MTRVSLRCSLLLCGAYQLVGLFAVGLLTQAAIAQNSTKAPAKGASRPT